MRTSAPSAPLNSVLLYGTLSLLLFGPLAFGAVEPWSIFVLQVGTVGLALLWISKQLLDGAVSIRRNPLFLPMAAFGLLILLQIAFRRSEYPHGTISEALLDCTYGILCFLTAQAVFRTSQAKKLAIIFSLYGTAVASFAMLQGISPNGKLYWLRQPALGGWIYGPYVNHNHYAGLMELLLPVPMVLSLTHFTHSRKRMAAAAAAAIMGGTVFLSGSRGGMLAITVEIIVLGTLVLRQKQDMKAAIAGGVFTLIIAGVLVWLGGNELSQRLSTLGNVHADLTADVRLHINRDALRMFHARPILGWGLGSFPIVYPQYRTFYTNFFINEAHDDYLQLLVETGLAGTAIMLWFLIALFRNALRKINKWNSEVTGAFTLACLLGVIGILVHSTVDFNLHIPANAALFYVMSTLAAADPLMHQSRKRRPIEIPAEQALSAASEVV